MNKIPSRLSQKSTLLRFLGTLIAFGLLVYLLSQQGWHEIEASIREISFWRFVLAFGLMAISRVLVSIRWYVLLRASDPKVSFWQTFCITFAGLFATNFLPTTVGGDVIRLAGGIKYKIDAAICAASLIVDRLVGMAAMATAIPFAIPNLLAAPLFSVHPHFFLAFLMPLKLRELLKKVWTTGLKVINRLFVALSIWLKQPVSLLTALIVTWMHMFCLFGILYLFLTGMNEHISFWSVMGLYSLTYFVTLLPISINGYGLQEVSMTMIFSRLGGVSVASGLTTALLFRTIMMLTSLPGALTVPGMLSADAALTKSSNPQPSDDLGTP